MKKNQSYYNLPKSKNEILELKPSFYKLPDDRIVTERGYMDRLVY
jgi:hypothetical protein